MTISPSAPLTAPLNFLSALANNQVVKAIAGINNFNVAQVQLIAQAAQQAGVTALDVAAEPTVIAAAKAIFKGALVVSSVVPEKLAQAAALGATVVELGNFDALYDEGLYLGAEDVLSLAQQTRALLDAENLPALLCVTVPGHLSAEVQTRLAQALEAIGANLLQTEGACRLLDQQPRVQRLNATEKAALTLANTTVLRRACSLPILSASGLDSTNSAQAIVAGANGVGIGSAISQLNLVEAMVTELRAVQAALEAAATVKGALHYGLVS